MELAESWNTGDPMASPQPSCSPERFIQRTSISTQGQTDQTLADGDVVVFRKAGTLYGVIASQAVADAQGIFNLLPLPDRVPSADPVAQLLIIRQGPWLGFKSLAAGGRFLQARRRGPDHLCFYNTNWGTWEQWELVGDEPVGSWTKWTFHFRSRRLENFVFAVEVERMNRGAVSASVAYGQVQRLVQSVEQNVDEKQGNVLRAMSSLLTSEWKHFMQREIQARRAVQSELETLRLELLEVRNGAIAEIGKLNQDAEATVLYLMDQVAAKEDEARRLDETYAATSSARAAHQERLAESLGRRRAKLLLGGAFQGWLDAAIRRKRLHALQKRMNETRRTRFLSRVLGAWEQVWRRRAYLAVVEKKLRTRFKASVTARVMRVWQEWSHERRLVKSMVSEGKRRRETGLARRVVAQWRAVVELERGREELLKRLLDTWQVRTARRAFAKWREFRESRKSDVLLAGQLKRAFLLRTARASFRAWRERANLKREQRDWSENLMRAFRRRRLGSVLTAWREEACFARETERKVVECRRARLAAAAFEAWQDAVTDQRLRAALADGMRERLDGQLRSWAFDGWLSAVRAHRWGVQEAARLEHSVQEKRLRRAFIGWGQETAARKERERVVEFLARQGDRSAITNVFDGWKEYVQRKKGARDLKAGLRRRWAARCAVLAFEAWREYAAARRGKWAAFDRAVRYSERQMQARTVCAWREVVAGRRDVRKAVEAAQKIVGRGCVRRAFLAWRDETEREGERIARETELQERQMRRAEGWARKHALWEGFYAWRAFVAAAQEKRLEESHAAIEELLKEERAGAWAKRKLLEAAFVAWRCGVAEALEERRAADEEKLERRVREEKEEARKEGLAERWAVKRRLERGFRVWREETEGARIDRLAARIAENEEQIESEKADARRVEFADRWAKRRLEERGFVAWKAAVEEARGEKETERRAEEEERRREKWADGWGTRRRLERVWGVWRDEVQRRLVEEEEKTTREKELEVKAETFAGVWAKRRLLERAFASWVESGEEAKAEREANREEESRQEQREREDERRADWWAQRRLVEATFKAWVKVVEQFAEESEVAENTLRAAQEEATRKEERDASRAATWAARRLLESGFYGWAEAVHVAREERAIAEEEERRAGVRAVIWAKRRMLERAFLAWKAAVEESAAERVEEEARTAAQLEAEQRVMRRFLLAWQDVTSAAKEQRAAEEEARRAVLRGVIEAWAQQTERSLGIRREIVTRQKLSLQRHVFTAWREAYWQAGASREVAERVRKGRERHLLTSAFVLWRYRTARQAVLRRRLGAFREVRRSRQLAVALRAWCHVAVRRRTLRLAGERVAARINRRRLGEAFSAWGGYVAEKTAERGELGACITRKKMAKRWFMQWYWDAFDNEIHRSLVDIVSSTQLSINDAERAPLPTDRPNGHSPERNLFDPGRTSADDWKALFDRGLEARGLSAHAVRGLDATNGARTRRPEGYENGTESMNGTGNRIRHPLLKSPTVGSAITDGRTAGTNSGLRSVTLDAGLSLRTSGSRQLPPLGSDASKVDSNGHRHRAARSLTGSLGRWDYLKTDGVMGSLRAGNAGPLDGKGLLRKEGDVKEAMQDRGAILGSGSVPGSRYDKRDYAWRSLDLGQGLANSSLEVVRPRTSSGSGERSKESGSYSASR